MLLTPVFVVKCQVWSGGWAGERAGGLSRGIHITSFFEMEHAPEERGAGGGYERERGAGAVSEGKIRAGGGAWRMEASTLHCGVGIWSSSVARDGYVSRELCLDAFCCLPR